MLAALVPPPSLGLYDGYSAAYFPGGPATVPRSAEPVFSLQRVEGWRDESQQGKPVGIRHAVAAGGNLAVVTSGDGRIARWNYARAEQLNGGSVGTSDRQRVPAETIELPASMPKDARIHRIFTDPSGRALLVSVVLPNPAAEAAGAGHRGVHGSSVGATYFYPGVASAAGASKPRAKEITELKSSIVEAVAWPSYTAGGASTGALMVVGDVRGKVTQVRVEETAKPGLAGSTLTFTCDEMWRVPLPGATASPHIASLCLEPFAAAASAPPSRFAAVLTISAPQQRLYCLTGGPDMKALFSLSKGAVVHEVHPETALVRGAAPPVVPAGAGQAAAPRALTAGAAGASSSSSGNSSSVVAVAGTSAASAGALTAASARVPPASELTSYHSASHTLAVLTKAGVLVARVALGGGGTTTAADSGSLLQEVHVLPYPAVAAPSGGPSRGAGSSSGGSGGAMMGFGGAGNPFAELGSASGDGRGGYGSGRDRDAGRGGSSGAGASASGEQSLPIGVAVTDLHILLLYPHRLLALSRITWAVTFEAPLPEATYGTMRGMCMDRSFACGDSAAGSATRSTCAALYGPTALSSALTVWAWSDRGLFRVLVAEEDRDAWRLAVSKKDFKLARRLAGNDRISQSLITEAEADALFLASRMDDAADLYAQCPTRPFESVCLRFLNAGALSALQRYVGRRLEGADAAAAASGHARPGIHNLQRTVLATWLVEMFLNNLSSSRPAAVLGSSESIVNRFDAVSDAFRRFLRDHAAALDKRTTLALLTSHNCTDEYLLFCRQVGDWDAVLAHHAQHAEWADALEALVDVPKASSGWADLWYRYSPVLIPHLPDAVVDAWIAIMKETVKAAEARRRRLGYADDGGLAGLLDDGVGPEEPHLNPVMLIPALVRYQQVKAHMPASKLSVALRQQPGPAADAALAAVEADISATSVDVALRFLEWLVYSPAPGHNDPAIHNMLLQVYATQPEEDLLLAYISDQVTGLAPPPRGGAAGMDSETAAAAGTLGLDGDLDLDGPAAGPVFDLQQALRVCLAAGKHRASVKLYVAMGLYEDAVDLALGQVGLPVAKTAANACPKEFIATRKRLWTRIASWAISRAAVASAAGGGEGEGGEGATAAASGASASTGRGLTVHEAAREAVGILRSSDGVLRIEDVLPFFPGTVTIDAFRAEVAASLQQCNANITELRREMRQYTDAAERVRADIRSLRNRCGYLRPGTKCDLCGLPVLGASLQPFYLYQCAHVYHSSCLLTEMTTHLPGPARKRLDAWAASLVQLTAAAEAVAGGGSGESAASAHALEARPLGGKGGAHGAPAVHPVVHAASLAGLVPPNVDLALLDPSVFNPAELRAALTSRQTEVQAEIDKLVASECLLCGDVTIDSIGDPLGEGGPAGVVFGAAVGTRGRSHHATYSHAEEDDWDI